ncbi:MAG TPA: coenzyme F420 hydrogenase [Desulfurococcales archaeon]|nr:coenzyme F420 hydrogenase [Desulfurococcales archaeon]
MAETSIHLLERIAGEAKLIVFHDGSKVTDTFFLTSTPVRGFERIVLGKNPLFVIEAVKRICGICHAAHAIAAAEAFEDAMGITSPPNGRILREVIGLINRVQSHITHLALILPDLVEPSNLNTLLIECMKLLGAVNEVMTRIGGAPTHPTNITIGGVLKAPTEAALKESLRRIGDVRKRYSVLQENILSSMNNSEKINLLKKHTIPDNIGFLASHLFYGDKYTINVKYVNVVRYEKYKGSSVSGEYKTTSMIALYNKHVVEVGPRARLSLFREFNNRSLIALQIARFIEIDIVLQRITELLERVSLTAPVRSIVMAYGYGRGVGVYEAPRGILIHLVELGSEGRVKQYHIVVPTMFIIPVIEHTLRGLPVKIVDVIPRLFDPCIPCSTHLIEV